jgi:molybdenum cofactor cytidylyltransferase
MKLHQAFDVVRGDVVAFIGAGGKTSALIGLAYELHDLDWRVLATTTTTILEDQLQLIPHAMLYTSEPKQISEALSEHGFVFLYDRLHNGKVYGSPVGKIKQLLDTVDSDVLLIEADDADGMLLKAPYPDEPAIPNEASLVIPIASLGVLNQPFDEKHIYNPDAIIEKYGFYKGALVHSPWIAQILRDEEMGLRGVPEKARVIAFINQTPTEGYLRGRARLIARMALNSSRLQGVALGAVRASEPICEVHRTIGAIVLAAGSASRMGEAKVLLPWTQGRNIIEHIMEQLFRARLNPIHVVTGYYAHQVKSCVKAMGVRAVHNRAFKTGEMISSIKAGLRAMPDNVAAALLVLGDQPRMEPKVLFHLLQAYAEGEGDLLAPRYQGQYGYPILVARRYWQDFLEMPNHQSSDELFDTIADKMCYINVNTDSILRDIDTPQDYEEERCRAGLMRHSPRALPKSDAS